MKTASGGAAYAGLLGGKGLLTYNADGSMAFSYHQEKSFQHALQAAAAAAATWSMAQQAMASEVTNRFAAGQVTQQQAQQLKFEISKIQSDADLAKFMAALEQQ